MKNLVLHRAVHSDIGRSPVIGDFIIERRKFGHLDEIAKAFLGHDIVGDVELIVGRFLRIDSGPSIETADILVFERIGTKILEKRIQFRQRIGYSGSA